MFSSIPEEKRPEVITNCYWPLLYLAQRGHKISIEATGLTLEIIQQINPEWIKEFRDLLSKNKIELIGSGYAQIIAPLVPYDVNIQNIRIGQSVYRSLLGIEPSVYLVNEMAFSSDLIGIYHDCGIRNIIFEWNNFQKYTKGSSPDQFDQPLAIYAGANKGQTLNVIWANSIAFQKFQRCIHQELSELELLNYVDGVAAEHPGAYFALYSSDAEIFDFRPGRYKTENSLNAGEWLRIESIYRKLEHKYKFVFLAEALAKIKEIEPFRFESLVPIQVKKQEKYNIHRWALSGRNSFLINSQCYQALDHYRAENITDDIKWKELLFLWSSDFRTHITENRFAGFDTAVKKLLAGRYDRKASPQPALGQPALCETTDTFITVESGQYKIVLNRKKGLTIHSFQKNGVALLGHIPHATFDDISFSNDYFSGHTLCFDMLEKQYTHLFPRDEVIEVNDNSVAITAASKLGDHLEVTDRYVISELGLCIERDINVLNPVIKIVRPFVFSFLPEQLQQEHVSYQVTCGGKEPQQYMLDDYPDQHSQYATISALHGFPMTDGKLSVGIDKQDVFFEIDNTISPLMARFEFKKEIGVGIRKLPLLRLIFSALEVDDTLKLNDRESMIRSRIRIY